MKILDVLNRENWIQGVSAQTADGLPLSPDSVNACKYCLFGAIIRVYGDGAMFISNRLSDKLGKWVPEWNDDPSRTWEDVEKVVLESGL